MYLRTFNGRTELVYEPQETLDDIEIFVEKLKNKNQPPIFKRFDGVYGIPAGGLVLAVCLHYRLDLPLLLAPTKKTLIVDDIVDTGHTMKPYIERGNYCISIFYNKKAICTPDEWLREKENDWWIRFLLWEGMEDYMNPYEKSGGWR